MGLRQSTDLDLLTYDEVRDKAGRGSDRVCRTIAATDLRLVASFVSEVVNGFQEDMRSLQ